MIAQAGDGAGQHGFDALALADFAGDLVGQAFIRRLAHEVQGLADFRLRHDVQVWRLLELHRQSLLQSAVENRVAGGVDEVGQQHAVFLTQLGGLA